MEYLGIDAITTNNLIREIIEEINENYYDNVTREKLEEGAINGMLGFLDEHSVYIPEDDFDAFNRSSRGSFLGIGIEIQQAKEGIEVCSVIDESPAAAAGLQISDIITKIDGKDVAEMSMKDIMLKFCSDLSSTIVLSISRNKNVQLDVSVKKSVIQIQSIKTSLISNIAVIKINYFNDSTVSFVKKFLKKIVKTSAKGIIFDLRNNPGGIVQQAIDFCDLLLPEGKIVEFKSRRADESRSVYAKGHDISNGLAMAVLIDKNTASGAELAAAALGENKRAILIGEKTYGKGSLQNIIPIPGRGAIKLTTSTFFSPKGNQINQKGVTPDIEIIGTQEQNDQKDSVLQRAIDLLQGLSVLDKSTPQQK